MDEARIAAFAGAGVTRVSVGVQDFDPVVQAAIGRKQSLETTRRVIEEFRAQGIISINIDLMYGLPRQTRESVERTIAQVLHLDPDRIAIVDHRQSCHYMV
jgi:oxygen-independent coproporphyrinogen-3 oxidase